jgi:hypothetical protein
MGRDLVDKTVTGVCNVVRGILHDPYTDRDVTYDESVYSGSVQIDHIVPLSYAWRAGAEQWDKSKRVEFANDQARNLLAVDGRANAGKGDSGPGEWLPVNAGFRCKYARDWAQVLYAYRLHVAPADYDSLNLLLQQTSRARHPIERHDHPMRVTQQLTARRVRRARRYIAQDACPARWGIMHRWAPCAHLALAPVVFARCTGCGRVE